MPSSTVLANFRGLSYRKESNHQFHGYPPTAGTGQKRSPAMKPHLPQRSRGYMDMPTLLRVHEGKHQPALAAPRGPHSQDASQPLLLLGAHTHKMPAHRPLYLVPSIQGSLFSHPCQVHASMDTSTKTGQEKSLLSFTELPWPHCTLQHTHFAKNLASATLAEDLLKRSNNSQIGYKQKPCCWSLRMEPGNTLQSPPP